MAKTYKIKFNQAVMAGYALWEIIAWKIPESKYKIDTDECSIKFASSDVVDVITESIPQKYYSIELEK